MSNDNSWDQNRLDIKNTLKRIEGQNEKLLLEVQDIKTDLAVHKVRSGFFGALAGAFVSIGAWFMKGQ